MPRKPGSRILASSLSPATARTTYLGSHAQTHHPVLCGRHDLFLSRAIWSRTRLGLSSHDGDLAAGRICAGGRPPRRILPCTSDLCGCLCCKRRLVRSELRCGRYCGRQRIRSLRGCRSGQLVGGRAQCIPRAHRRRQIRVDRDHRRGHWRKREREHRSRRRNFGSHRTSRLGKVRLHLVATLDEPLSRDADDIAGARPMGNGPPRDRSTFAYFWNRLPSSPRQALLGRSPSAHRRPLR